MPYCITISPQDLTWNNSLSLFLTKTTQAYTSCNLPQNYLNFARLYRGKYHITAHMHTKLTFKSMLSRHACNLRT